MSDFEAFNGLPKRTIPTTPEAAGLPSDTEVKQALRAAVIASDPDSFWPEQRFGINGDGNYDRGDVYAPACTFTMRAAGAAMLRKVD